MQNYIVQIRECGQWFNGDVVRMDPKHLTKYLSFLAGEIEISGLKRKARRKPLPTRVVLYHGRVYLGHIEFDGEKFTRYDEAGQEAA